MLGAKMICFFSPLPYGEPYGGSVFSSLLQNRLAELTSDLRICRPRGATSFVASAARIFNRYVSHPANPYLEEINQSLAMGFRIFVIDTVNLGWLAGAIRRRCPEARILVISHNDEIAYARGRTDLSHIAKCALIIRLQSSERIALSQADQMSHVTRFDLCAVQERHPETCRANQIVIPVACASPPTSDNGERNGRDLGFVFVGSNFFANRCAIPFLDKLAERNEHPISLVGSICESAEARQAKALNLIGRVGELGPIYSRSIGAIVPVVDGSGMKVKVAESLAHGRPVIASAQAARGYEAAVAAGVVQIVPDGDYGSALASVSRATPSPDACRTIFSAEYSGSALRRHLSKALQPWF